MNFRDAQKSPPRLLPNPIGGFLVFATDQIRRTFASRAQFENAKADEFDQLLILSKISSRFFNSEICVLNGCHIVRLRRRPTVTAEGGEEIAIFSDFYRPRSPVYRDLPLRFAHFDLLNKTRVKFYGLECAPSVTPTAGAKMIENLKLDFQPCYTSFHHHVWTPLFGQTKIQIAPKIWDEKKSGEFFYSKIDEIFLPQRTFVFLPNFFVDENVGVLRDASLALLILSKNVQTLEGGRPLLAISEDEKSENRVAQIFAGRGFEREIREIRGFTFSIQPTYTHIDGSGRMSKRSAAFLLSESPIRLVFVVRGNYKAHGLLNRVIQEARFYHALLLQLPTVGESDVCVIYDLNRDDDDDGEVGDVQFCSVDEYADGYGGRIGDLRNCKNFAWFCDFCDQNDRFLRFSTEKNHRFWFVQNVDASRNFI